jgi:hypothetical protein
MKSLCLLATLAAVLSVPFTQAYACACCSDFGQRLVGLRNIDSSTLDIIRRLHFAGAAELFLGERDATDIKGISGLSPQSRVFDLTVAQQQDRWSFRFRDKEGHFGSLTVLPPQFVAVFEVDPREEKRMPEGGQGPRLYKEWKLTGKVQGTGVFSTGMGPEQRITVILQGHGNSCTTSEDFTAWTLVVYGPRADYSLIGNLIPGGNADR